MNNDATEMPTPHDTTPLDATPATHSILDLDSKTAAEYGEDTKPQRDLVQLQEHIQQLQEWFKQLGSTQASPHRLRS